MYKNAVKLRALAVLFITVLILPAIAGCIEQSAPSAVTHYDDLGREIILNKVPERVVSLAPSITEIIFAVGAGELLVGRDTASDYPVDALNATVVSSYWTGLDGEALLELEPDIVFIDGYLDLAGTQRTELESLSKAFENAGGDGFAVVVLKADDIDSMLLDTLLVGEILDKKDQAEEKVTELRQRMNAVTSLTAAIDTSNLTRVIDVTYWDSSLEPGAGGDIWVVGRNTFADDLITLAGGTNLAAEKNGYTTITIEELIAYNPEMIITPLELVWPTETHNNIVNDSRLQGVAAVANGNVHQVYADLLARPGPRLIDGLETLADLFHPELFSGDGA